MKPATLVPVAEYLSTSYRPDCEYLEGALLERNAGEFDHSRLQARLAFLFERNVDAWGFAVLTEQRVQAKTERLRVPDVCGVRLDAPEEQILTHPPQLCVEILSKDDRMGEMQDRIDDYLAFGVPCVWLIDPKSRKARIHTGEKSYEPGDGVLRVEGTAIAVPLPDLFKVLRTKKV